MINRKRLRSLVLVLLLLTACGAAAETDIHPVEWPVPVSAEMTFALRSGITWDTSPDQLMEIMTEIEKVKRDGDIDVIREESFTVYLMHGLTLGEIPVMLACYFQQERLIIAAYYFQPDSEIAFFALQERLIEEYGLPTDDDKAIAAALLNAVTPGMVTEEDFTAAVDWLFGDGTRMCLVDHDGEYTLFYFNAPVLLGGNGGS